MATAKKSTKETSGTNGEGPRPIARGTKRTIAKSIKTTKVRSEAALEARRLGKNSATVYESPVLASAHEGMEGLYALGLVDKTTMREFDESCLIPVAQLAPPDIRALREREAVSQSVLARHLGIATATLGQWERGLRKPDGPALRLLSLVERHGLDYIR